jgi:choline dehydrogenase-like flavoprotein
MLSDSYWDCASRHITHNFDHDVSTCPMGPPDDPNAVVDPELRVYGVPNLRVADASVMPEMISGNTYAPCVMIGEVVADMIKRDHGFTHGIKTAGVAYSVLNRHRKK